MERDERPREDGALDADSVYGRRFRQVEDLFHRALEIPPERRSEWLASITDDDALRARVAELLEHHRDGEDLTERWARIEVVLDELLCLASEERPSRLDVLCAGDTRLRRDVERLIRMDSRTGVLDRSLTDFVGGPENPFSEGTRSASVGPYRIVRELGQGGMGVVYEAERPDLGKRVALKLARESFLSPERVQRFELEERLLARFQHPNIAQLHDAGVTEDGAPWFAMELVEGDTIVRHARDAGLTTRERLERFLDVCAAVQYAHRRLVVHRDIKPSNVLVTRSGQVKLMDFGVAKLMENPGMPGLTRTETRIFTPGYAAPEQLRGEAVTTATDVYQLGALLYELLAEQPAFDVADLSPYRAERLVLETDPPAPSRAARGDASRGAVIHRDLDSIVLKALAKEPERRYTSVEALAEDIRRFTNGEPVRARAGGWMYRSRKFVRRHRAATAVAGLVLVSTATALVQARTIAAERDRAEREAGTARQVSNFMVGLFEDATPGEGGVDAIALVDQGAERLDRELADQPEVRASFQEALGRVYQALGRYDRSEALLEASLATRRELFGDDAAETASSQHFLAQLAFSLSEYDRADSLARIALGIRERAFGRASPQVMETLGDLAGVRYNTGEYAEAETLARESADIGRTIFPDGDERTGTALNTLANALWAQGRREEARGVMRDASEVHRTVYGGEHRALAITLNNLAFMTHASGGPLDEARTAATQALAMQRRLYPDGHPDIAWTLNNLGEIALLGGDTTGAEAIHREAFDLRRGLLEPDHADLIQSHWQLGRVALATRRYEEAEAHFREALRITEVAYGPDHPLIARYTYHLAQVELGSGRIEQGRRSLERAYAAGRTSYGPDHPTVVDWGREVAAELRKAGELERALAVEAELPTDSTEVSGS